MSVSNIITEVNKSIPECLKAKVYGLAQTVIRTRAGDEYEFLPGIVSDNGEVKYVGLDDTESIIIYHKCKGITCNTKPGRGDSYDVLNVYDNAMIVYSDRQKTKLRPDELVLLIQANLPSTITLAPYMLIAVKFLNVVLNDQVVFLQEYKETDFRLPANKNLIQINYSIETTFQKRCFKECP